MAVHGGNRGPLRAIRFELSAQGRGCQLYAEELIQCVALITVTLRHAPRLHNAYTQNMPAR